MSKRELKSLTGSSEVSISRDKGQVLQSAGHMSKSREEMPEMSEEELNTRIEELEGDLEIAHQAAKDSTRDLEVSRCAATVTTESLQKRVEELTAKGDDFKFVGDDRTNGSGPCYKGTHRGHKVNREIP